MFCQIQLCFVILYVIFCASVCRNIDLLSLVVFLVAIYAVFSTQWMQLLLWDPSCSPRKRSQIHDYLHLQLMYESDIITWNVQKNKELNYHLTTIYNITMTYFPPGIFPSRHLESHAGESSYLSNQFQTSLVVMYGRIPKISNKKICFYKVF